jgi:hypothetical protein
LSQLIPDYSVLVSNVAVDNSLGISIGRFREMKLERWLLLYGYVVLFV